mmetsp:Transcript_37972/g.150944  ORF Transcript_37972/g.150944 Transcript_37972/m.150944 type:complete len:86 (+) Transcript_37972:1736-1993(+)
MYENIYQHRNAWREVYIRLSRVFNILTTALTARSNYPAGLSCSRKEMKKENDMGATSSFLVGSKAGIGINAPGRAQCGKLVSWLV